MPLDDPSTDLKAYLTDTARAQINDSNAATSGCTTGSGAPAEAANTYNPDLDVEWCTHMGNPLALQDLNEGAGGAYIYIGAVKDH